MLLPTLLGNKKRILFGSTSFQYCNFTSAGTGHLNLDLWASTDYKRLITSLEVGHKMQYFGHVSNNMVFLNLAFPHVSFPSGPESTTKASFPPWKPQSRCVPPASQLWETSQVRRLPWLLFMSYRCSLAHLGPFPKFIWSSWAANAIASCGHRIARIALSKGRSSVSAGLFHCYCQNRNIWKTVPSVSPVHLASTFRLTD